MQAKRSVHGMSWPRPLMASVRSQLRTGWLALAPRAGRGIAWVRYHALPLAIVALACAVTQMATLMQPLNTYQWPDTVQYMGVAERILRAGQFADPIRTPGYPAFIALVFALAGAGNTRAIVVAQAGLMVLATFEIYTLAYRLGRRRWAACMIAVVIGTNLFILQWERLLLSETLAYWLVVTIFLLFERYLRAQRTSTLVWLALFAAAAILTRPIFIFLPAALWLVLAYRDMRLGTLRQQWRTLALACVVSYGLVVADMAVNAATFGYFGLSQVGSFNLFAKMLEAHTSYGMPVSGADPQFAPLQADITAYLASGNTDGFRFLHTYPRWNTHYWFVCGAYSTQILLRHPIYYLHTSAADVRQTWTLRPWLWAPYVVQPGWVHALIKVSFLHYRAYFALPLLLLGLVVWVWRRAEQIVGVTLLALAVCIAGQILTAGALDYTEFDRLRLPFDWAMTFVVLMLAVEACLTGARALPRRSVASAGAGQSAPAPLPARLLRIGATLAGARPQWRPWRVSRVSRRAAQVPEPSALEGAAPPHLSERDSAT